MRNRSLQEVRILSSVGNLEAIHDLCYRYKYGIKASLDLKEAFNWCSKAAARGVSSAQVLLAEMYYYGEGVEKNYKQALFWYSAAAAQDHAHALLMLFYIYSEGSGVTPDKALAMRFLQAAADSGYQSAIDEMGKQKRPLPDE